MLFVAYERFKHLSIEEFVDAYIRDTTGSLDEEFCDGNIKYNSLEEFVEQYEKYKSLYDLSKEDQRKRYEECDKMIKECTEWYNDKINNL